MRITDQYFWNFLFLLFFITLVVMGAVILESEAYKSFAEITVFDIILLMLASQRIVRFVIYDKIFAFFREQFYDAEVLKTRVRLVKPQSGPKRTLSDLLSCPWCFGVWAAAMVIFFYFLTPYAFYPVLLLAVSSGATFLQLLANLIGWKAEEAKQRVG